VATHALDRHVVLVGFMGAGKTTVGAAVAARLGREFLDVDREMERAEGPVAALFEERGEAAFRELEATFVARACDRRDPSVIAVGGGAVERHDFLHGRDVFVVHLDVDVGTAWERCRDSRRPLARDEQEFRRRYALRAPLYAEIADARANDAEDVVLAAAGVHVERGALARLGELVPHAPTALVSDARVGGIHGADAQVALGGRALEVHELPEGEQAKSVDAVAELWEALRLGRSGVLVALGGGCTTDAAGFVAATYLRGIRWVAVPSTLVGQVDAGIGGKTGIDLRAGKNLVGAFHWPERTVIDPALLATLPDGERREGMAEVVKTGLLAGEPLWERADAELVRSCAAFKSAICLRDPHDRGERAVLNLGHTFAHALEAAAGYSGVTHGHAVALGLLAALRLSGADTSPVEELLRPARVRVDRERAWQALRRDKKAENGRVKLVLLDAPGRPVFGVERPEAEVRAALDSLIAD